MIILLPLRVSQNSTVHCTLQLHARQQQQLVYWQQLPGTIVYCQLRVAPCYQLASSSAVGSYQYSTTLFTPMLYCQRRSKCLFQTLTTLVGLDCIWIFGVASLSKRSLNLCTGMKKKKERLKVYMVPYQIISVLTHTR